VARLVRWTPEPPLVSATGIGPLRAALGLWQLERYPDVVQSRNENANGLRNLAGCTDWHVGPDVLPAWLRLKVIPRKPQDALVIARRLQRRGLRVGNFNWTRTIQEHLVGPDVSNSQYLSRHCLDVPIHQHMTKDELACIAEALQEA
jgi:dTDP-4-amino-4,6-dideoxygalactose transaminase